MTASFEPPSGWFAERYNVGGMLGSGYAVVVRATDQHLNREVALKLIRADADATDLSRWERERDIMVELGGLATVSHLPAIYDSGTHEEFLFFAMSLYRGGSLHARVAEHGPLTLAQAAVVLRNLNALDAVHDSDICHRDIKPANVLAMERFPALATCGLCDWGIAQRGNDETLSNQGDVVGTPRYMSPQRRSGLRATPSDDEYAVGRTVQDLLTGYGSGGPLSPIPAAVARVLERATDPDPEARYDSIRALTSAFEKAARLDMTKSGSWRSTTAHAHRTPRRGDTLVQRVRRGGLRADEVGGRASSASGIRLLLGWGRVARLRREVTALRREIASQDVSDLAANVVEDEHADAVAAAAGAGGRVRPVPHPVVDLMEFARRKARGLTDVSDGGNDGGVRKFVAEFPARTLQVGGWAGRYGTWFAIAAAGFAVAMAWVVSSARLPPAIIGHLWARGPAAGALAGDLAWAAVDALLFAAACRMVAEVLWARARALAVSACFALGLVALMVGFGAHEHTTSPLYLAPGQWYVVGSCLLILGVLRSVGIRFVDQLIPLAFVLALSVPFRTLLLVLWAMVGVAAVGAVVLALGHRSRPLDITPSP